MHREKAPLTQENSQVLKIINQNKYEQKRKDTPPIKTPGILRIWGMNIYGLSPDSESRGQKILLGVKQQNFDVVMVCESNGILRIPGYITHYTTLQDKCKGINIIIRDTISSECMLQCGGHLLVVRICNPDMVLMCIHISNREILYKINNELYCMKWETPTFIFCDANQWEDNIAIPVKWIHFKKTYERGIIESSPDIIGFIHCEGEGRVGSKVSDHYSIISNVSWTGEKDVSSLFPYGKEHIIKQIKKGKMNPMWPDEPANLEFAIKIPARQKIWTNPNYIGNPNWKKLALHKFYSNLAQAWRKNDLKAIYRMVKHKCERNSSTLALYIKNENGNIKPISACENDVKEYFSKIFCKLDETFHFQAEPLHSRVPYLPGLYKNKAIGWDLVPDRVLKLIKINNELQPAFPDIFNKVKIFYENATFIPKYAKLGRLILLSKTGKPCVYLKDTRPIIIMPWIYKGFESSIKSQVDNDIWKHIGPWQNGFRPGKSTHNNIIYLKNWMDSRKINKKKSVILYVDIKKAFDHVLRSLLLKRLSEVITDVDTLNVLKNLLSDTAIRIGNTTITTNVGVPQGALLSPILFNLYVEEALKELYNARGPNGLLLAYADNILIAGAPEQVGKWEYIINSWKSKWNLEVEWSKCQLCCYKTSIKSLAMTSKNFRYLGVNISWAERVPRRTMELWAKQRTKKWFKRHSLVTRLSIFWFDISLLIYKFYADYIRDKISEQQLTIVAIKVARKRLAIPHYINNTTIMEMLWIDPGIIVLNRAIREGYPKQPFIRTWKLRRNIWARIYEEMSIARIGSIWNSKTYSICSICGKEFSKHHMRFHPHYKEWVKWFSGRTLLGALINIQEKWNNNDPKSILALFKRVESLREEVRIYHGE